jgi:16S rRNA (cytosine967-C5)-methyltransferase
MKPPHPTQVRQAIAVLEAVMQRAVPADALLAQHFRQHKQMGRRDRAYVSDLVYGVLRDWRRLSTVVGTAPPALVGAVLAEIYGCDEAALNKLGIADADTLFAQLNDPAELPWAVRANLPAVIAEDFVDTLPETEWPAAAAALNTAGTADFRVNRLLAERDPVLAELAQRDIEARPTPWAADGIRLTRRLPNGDPLLRGGQLTPQDEGSQWLVQALPLDAGMQVLDYCAGAGGKALAMAARLAGSGAVHATDSDAARLSRLPVRAEQAQAAITVLPFPPPADARYDGVLVDAPCSGTGSLRRAPERRLDRPDLAALHALQVQILGDAARHVRPGGWLVYATCSLLHIENEAVTKAFGAAHSAFTPCDLPLPDGGGAPMIRLWPHRHHTDGFFAAGWRRCA